LFPRSTIRFLDPKTQDAVFYFSRPPGLLYSVFSPPADNLRGAPQHARHPPVFFLFFAIAGTVSANLDLRLCPLFVVPSGLVPSPVPPERSAAVAPTCSVHGSRGSKTSVISQFKGVFVSRSAWPALARDLPPVAHPLPAWFCFVWGCFFFFLVCFFVRESSFYCSCLPTGFLFWLWFTSGSFYTVSLLFVSLFQLQRWTWPVGFLPPPLPCPVLGPLPLPPSHVRHSFPRPATSSPVTFFPRLTHFLLHPPPQDPSPPFVPPFGRAFGPPPPPAPSCGFGTEIPSGF